MTENKQFTYFIEDNGYWIRNESDFKIIATGLMLGVAQNLTVILNELHEENVKLQGMYDAQKQLYCQLNSDKNNIWQDYQDLKKENEQLRKENYSNLDGLNYYQEQNGYLSERVSELECENQQLKKTINELSTFDKEDFIEVEYINTIYKEFGFKGVINYAKDRLEKYGAVKEVEKGLWVMVTGGWSDNEFWLDCLNNFVSIFAMKHYCAYEKGGAFYYTEKPHDNIEIRLKR